MPSVLWFRRDLRLLDNPALLAAAQADGTVVPVFVVDPALWGPAGPVRRAYLAASLHSLNESLGGGLVIRNGDPTVAIPELVRAVNASSVHVAEDFGPYGRARDAVVDVALGPVALVRSGSSYAVSPGRIRKDDGTAYRMFTPYSRGWLRHGWRAPAAEPASDITWRAADSDDLPDPPDLGQLVLPPAGEESAWNTWSAFRATSGYASNRDRPDLHGTSSLSHHLKFGEIHPRSLLAELRNGSKDDEKFRSELCWREFYADVLANHPDSARHSMDPRFDDGMRWTHGADAERAFDAWCHGRTGFPLVDAGMRQLRGEGWMHNRVRMVVASFLVKDLHLPWQRGASEFMTWLRDGDLASNAHGWQWTAGCGTDAAPFHRIFNPVRQGITFDPEGEYIRRYVPELRHLRGSAAHEPWTHEDGYRHGYSERIVDHAVERVTALEDFASIRRPS